MKRRMISAAALPAVGQPFAGGLYAGRIYFDGSEFALIDAGREYECAAHWWDQPGPKPRIRGATSRSDGLANTLAMSEHGSAIATKVLGMNIRGSWGWHIPSIEELQLLRSNLLQLGDWDHRGCGQSMAAAQAFAQGDYWSSTQKDNAATAWRITMKPWCVPDTTWVSACKGIRPVKVLQIKDTPFIHAPQNADLAFVARDFSGLADSPEVAEVLSRFVNEDTGRFYGRTDELVAALAAIGGRA